MNLGFRGHWKTVVWMVGVLLIVVFIYPWQNELIHDEEKKSSSNFSREQRLATAKQGASNEAEDDLDSKNSVTRRALGLRATKAQGQGACPDCGKNHGAAHSVLIKHLNRSTEGLVEIEIEGGGTAIDLNGRFHHGSSASINDAGEVTILCSTSITDVLHGSDGVGDSASLVMKTALK